MLEVVIPLPPGQSSPAALALSLERVEFELHDVDDAYAYGALLAQMWKRGRGFHLVEHDVVPWPGALAALEQCDQLWCGYDYPLLGTLGGALGCVRFSTDFVLGHPRLAEVWSDVEWQRLDAAVCGACVRASGQSYYHAHLPPVAHVRPAERL